jgi:hypothetical protein
LDVHDSSFIKTNGRKIPVCADGEDTFSMVSGIASFIFRDSVSSGSSTHVLAKALVRDHPIDMPQFSFYQWIDFQIGR